MCIQKANKPKTNSALQLGVYIFEERRDQSISNISIRLHPFSRTRLPTNEICAWLPCYRFQRGPNLPLEIRPLSPLFLHFSFSPSFSQTDTNTLTHISSRVTQSCLGQHIECWLLQPVGKSCRANCLVQYLKLLDMINNVLRGCVSHQTAHHKHISAGNYSFTFSHTFILYLPFWPGDPYQKHLQHLSCI